MKNSSCIIIISYLRNGVKKTRSKCHSTHPTVKYVDCNVMVLAADDDAYQINYTIIYNPYIGTIKILILS